MFDSTCKFIAATFSRDIATWLLGKPMDLTEIKPTELSLEPIRADSLIFLESEDLILHLEFQTNPEANIPFRMLDYRVRLYRLSPQKEVRQIVIYLQKSNSDLVNQEVFKLSQTHHKFKVIRLWEVETEALLQAPGLWPFAVLSQTKNREAVLTEVAYRLEGLTDRGEQSNVAASTALLAGLVLDRRLIQRILTEDIMRESVIYQDIKEKGREEGLQQGLQQGEVILVLRQLNRRFGQVAPAIKEQVRQLPVKQLEDLGEALLDFTSEIDLVNWLGNR